MKRLMQALGAVLLATSVWHAVPAGAAEPTKNTLPNLAAPSDHAAKALKRDAVCTKCHDETENAPVLSIYQTRHGVRADERTPQCQSCHGDSDKHVKGVEGAKLRPPTDVVFKKGTYPVSNAHTQNGQCSSCHADGKRHQWEGSQHQTRDVTCSNCHKVHVARDKVLNKLTQSEICFTCHKEQRAQVHRISSHPIVAGKVACSDCHNPHGSSGPKLVNKGSINETCYTCHAEKRGPFLWEHSPVQEDCATCHNPHGSNTAPLLKARAPFLCQQCHDADHGSTLRGGQQLAGTNFAARVAGDANAAITSAAAQGNARMCMNCHSQVHGSNHPAGSKFNR
jgi:DmsE family decaheme c-type cytochrome